MTDPAPTDRTPSVVVHQLAAASHYLDQLAPGYSYVVGPGRFDGVSVHFNSYIRAASGDTRCLVVLAIATVLDLPCAALPAPESPTALVSVSGHAFIDAITLACARSTRVDLLVDLARILGVDVELYS